MSPVKINGTEGMLIMFCRNADHTYSEIGRHLGVPDATVRRMVSTLRKKGLEIRIKLRHPTSAQAPCYGKRPAKPPREVDDALELLHCNRAGGPCPILVRRVLNEFEK